MRHPPHPPHSPRPLAACSWSFQTDDPTALVQACENTSIVALQLHLDPFARGIDAVDLANRFGTAGIAFVSGMMAPVGEDYTSIDSIRRTGGLRPTEHWPANRDAAERNADLAAGLGLDLITLHAGFIPDDPDDPERAALLGRLIALADIFAARQIRLGLETGQESADTLEAVLAELDHPSIGVNFDPANMILYGSGDPIEALERLAPRVMQIHIKDALPSDNPDLWGEEVPAGTGDVPWPRFFEMVEARCPGVPAAIEREAGDARESDIRHAAEFVRGHIATT